MRRARASASHRSLSGTALLVLLAQVVASLLQRPELRPILSALGWSDSQRRRGSDDAVVTSIRDFLATHLHSDGTRLGEQQAASPCQNSSGRRKEEDGLFYLARSEYDLACGQV